MDEYTFIHAHIEYSQTRTRLRYIQICPGDKSYAFIGYFQGLSSSLVLPRKEIICIKPVSIQRREMNKGIQMTRKKYKLSEITHAHWCFLHLSDLLLFARVNCQFYFSIRIIFAQIWESSFSPFMKNSSFLLFFFFVLFFFSSLHVQCLSMLSHFCQWFFKQVNWTSLWNITGFIRFYNYPIFFGIFLICRFLWPNFAHTTIKNDSVFSKSHFNVF